MRLGLLDGLWLYSFGPNGQLHSRHNFSMNVKCRFDECDFPWNGVMAVYIKKWRHHYIEALKSLEEDL